MDHAMRKRAREATAPPENRAEWLVYRRHWERAGVRWPPDPWVNCDHGDIEKCRGNKCYMVMARHIPNAYTNPAWQRTSETEIVCVVSGCFYTYHGVQGFKRDRSRAPGPGHYAQCECRRED